MRALRSRSMWWPASRPDPEFRPRVDRPILPVGDVPMASDSSSAIASNRAHPSRRCSRDLVSRHRTLDGVTKAVSQADGIRLDRRGRLHNAGGTDRQLGLPDHDPETARLRGAGPGWQALPKAHARVSERVDLRRQSSEDGGATRVSRESSWPTSPTRELATSRSSPKSSRSRPSWSFTRAFIGYKTSARTAGVAPKTSPWCFASRARRPRIGSRKHSVLPEPVPVVTTRLLPSTRHFFTDSAGC